MRCLIDYARRKRGLGPLHHSALLDRSSLLRGERIRACGQFSHMPCGDAFATPFVAVGYFKGRSEVGENLAWYDASGASPRAMVSMWLSSPEHRANLFGRRWRDVGVAVVDAPGLFGRPAPRVWVSQFGRRR